MNARRDHGGVALVALAASAWGTWSLWLYPAALPAQIAAPIMFAVTGVAALPLAWREPAPTWDRAALAALVANALFDAVNVAAFFAALAVTTVQIAVIAHYAAPILVALAAPRIDGVRTRGAGPAAIVALAGLVVVLEPWREAAPGALAGVALGLVSAVCYAGNVFTVRRLAAKVGSARAVATHSLLAAALLLPLLATRAGDFTTHGALLVAAGAVINGAGATIAFVAGLARIGAARAAVLAFAEPLVAVAVGRLCWDQPLHPIAALGGVAVLAAGVHVARQAR